MSDDRDFVNGMIIKKPNDNAPEWVKAKMLSNLMTSRAGSVALSLPTLMTRINIDIKESQKGTWYAERDTWKPEKKAFRPAAKETDDIP